MATKLMIAPALARREPGASPGTPAAPRPASADPKAKRRRSSVYDADGNEVFITLMCLKCHKMRPLSQFGLRKMADGAIRNQPWCRTCRGGATAEPGTKRGRKAAAGEQDPSVSGESSGTDASQQERVLDAGTLAAQVVAALQGGRS